MSYCSWAGLLYAVYALAKELQPGKFRPTITHSFIRLLHDKGFLRTCFTQNIDTLERRAGVPAEKLIEAHGSFASHSCTKCKASYPDDKMQENVSSQRVPHCLKCKGLVKPDIVFFGESLPDSFIRGMGSLQNADLLIILGTSLTVHPFASLSHRVPSSCPRVLINLEEVGGIGSRSKDILLLGDCDTTVRELCKKLGWLDELEALWNATESLVEGKDKATEEDATTPTAREPETKDEKLSREVDALTKEVEKTLKLSEDHLEEVSAELAAPSKTNSVTTENTTDDDDDNQETDTDTGKKSEDVDETPSKS